MSYRQSWRALKKTESQSFDEAESWLNCLIQIE